MPLDKELSASCDSPRSLPPRSILMVVAPLNAFLSDQIESCNVKMKIKAVKIEEIQTIGDLNTDLIFTSPSNLGKYNGNNNDNSLLVPDLTVNNNNKMNSNLIICER